MSWLFDGDESESPGRRIFVLLQKLLNTRWRPWALFWEHAGLYSTIAIAFGVLPLSEFWFARDMVLAFSSVFPVDREPSGRLSGLLSQPLLMRGFLIWRAFTAIDHRRSDSTELPQPGASWHHQFIASTNDIAADILTNPIVWLCDTVLLVSFSYFVLFLLNSLISLLLSLSCPSLPHLEKQQIQIQVHKTFSLPLVSAATWNTGPLQAVIFFVLFFLVAQKLSVHRPGETSSIRSVLSTFMIPLLSLIIMGGFIVVGISAWGLLAGRWFQQFRPVRRLGQWLEMRSAAGGQDLERGWESGLISRGPSRKAIEEPEVLGFSGVMIVVDQKPVAPPSAPAQKPSAIELAPAAPRHIPVEKEILGPTLEEIEELRAGCRRIEDIRTRIQGRMVEMKVEIERIGGGDRYRPVPAVRRNRKKG